MFEEDGDYLKAVSLAKGNRLAREINS